MKATYVSSCVSHCPFFEIQLGSINLESRNGSGLWHDAMLLWAANSLLLKNWQAASFPPVDDKNSPIFGLKPAPRVMQNSLDLVLEAFVARLEKSLLQKISIALTKRSQVATWNELCAATFVLLAVMEKDIWRLVYWVRHKQEVGNLPKSNDLNMCGLIPREGLSMATPSDSCAAYRGSSLPSQQLNCPSSCFWTRPAFFAKPRWGLYCFSSNSRRFGHCRSQECWSNYLC